MSLLKREDVLHKNTLEYVEMLNSLLKSHYEILKMTDGIKLQGTN